jgi:Ca-activated chloride channel family protein
MILRSPLFLLFIPILGLILLYLEVRRGKERARRHGAVSYSSVGVLKEAPVSPRVRWARRLPWLRLVYLVLLVLALARPQIGLKETIVRQEGIDIVLALDVSTSMLAEDFVIRGARKNRLEAVQEVTAEFIAKRPHDRIGLVIFAGRPYILSPLTWDHNFSTVRLREVKAGMIEDGTAIGSALATAVNRLRESTAESKVVILLTDGVNNAGAIPPLAAAEAAAAMGVTVYTIGAGSDKPVPYPVTDPWGRKVYRNVEIGLDEELLKEMARITGGKYYHANDTASLVQIFQEIDRMTTTPLEMPVFREYRELYPYLLLAAFFLIALEAVLNNTIYRRLP